MPAKRRLARGVRPFFSVVPAVVTKSEIRLRTVLPGGRSATDSPAPTRAATSRLMTSIVTHDRQIRVPSGCWRETEAGSGAAYAVLARPNPLTATLTRTC